MCFVCITNIIYDIMLYSIYSEPRRDFNVSINSHNQVTFQRCCWILAKQAGSTARPNSIPARVMPTYVKDNIFDVFFSLTKPL